MEACGRRRPFAAANRVTAWLSGAFTVAILCLPLAAEAAVPNPIITGPIPANAPPGDPSHDYPQLATSLDLARSLDLASLGYVEEEYFFSGTANVYNTPTLATGTIVSSGHPYKSRIIVRRPMSPAQFNGTVLVEWVNVTSGYNNDVLFRQSQDHLVRAGYAYVGVSAQRVGVQVPPGGLTTWSPSRYGSLDVTDNGTITNDALSYDIFSQAAQAIRTPRGVDMLAGLPVRRIIAIGASQSQGRLVTYHNSIHPLADVFDGYVLVLGLGGRLRTDLGVKVFKVDTETDLLSLGEVAARQPDSDHLRTWEVAGASHSGFPDFTRRVGLVTRDSLPPPTPWICAIQPALSHVPTYQVLNAVYGHISRWISHGTLPPTAARVDVLSEGPPVVLHRTSLGLATGGIQLSQQAVPSAVENGINSGPGLCLLYGSHTPLHAATLARLYRNHHAYVSAVSDVNGDNVEAGYILSDDAEANIFEAAHSGILTTGSAKGEGHDFRRDR
jgi:hypothetical protein